MTLLAESWIFVMLFFLIGVGLGWLIWGRN